jgi:hypothetical protein
MLLTTLPLSVCSFNCTIYTFPYIYSSILLVQVPSLLIVWCFIQDWRFLHLCLLSLNTSLSCIFPSFHSILLLMHLIPLILWFYSIIPHFPLLSSIFLMSSPPPSTHTPTFPLFFPTFQLFPTLSNLSPLLKSPFPLVFFHTHPLI